MYTDTTKSPMNTIIRRHLKSTISVEVLPSKNWEDIASYEINRLKLEIMSYANQIINRPGYDEMMEAVENLDSANDRISGSLFSNIS